MNSIKYFFLTVFFVCAFASINSAQISLQGNVTKILSGNLIEVKTGENRTTQILLPFIATPFEEQAMHFEVKEHLSKMLLGKDVRIKITELSVLSSYNIQTGTVYLNDLDVGLQMLRDGAAWYYLPDKEKQNPAEREIYLKNETAAQNEKRGIWGVENLIPTWEYQKQVKEKYKKLIPKEIPNLRILETTVYDTYRFVWFPEIRMDNDMAIEGRFLQAFDSVIIRFDFFTSKPEFNNETKIKLIADGVDFPFSATTYKIRYDENNLNRYDGESISGLLSFYKFLELINKKEILLVVNDKKIKLNDEVKTFLTGLASKIQL